MMRTKQEFVLVIELITHLTCRLDGFWFIYVSIPLNLCMQSFILLCIYLYIESFIGISESLRSICIQVIVSSWATMPRSFQIRATSVTIFAHLLFIAIATLMLVWLLHFRGGVAFNSSNKIKIFNVSCSHSLIDYVAWIVKFIWFACLCVLTTYIFYFLVICSSIHF